MKRQIPILIAFAIFITSTTAGIFAYAAIIEREQAVASLLPEISAGVHQFSLRSHGKCFGIFTAQVPEVIEGYPRITYAGKISLIYKKSSLPVSIDGNVAFNSLGQVVSSLLSFSVNDTKLHFATHDINPLRLTMKLVKMGAISRHEILFPGPVELKALANGNFRISYPGLMRIQKGNFDELFINMFESLEITIDDSREQSKYCTAEQLKALDLTSYLITLEKLIRSAQTFLGA